MNDYEQTRSQISAFYVTIYIENDKICIAQLSEKIYEVRGIEARQKTVWACFKDREAQYPDTQ